MPISHKTAILVWVAILAATGCSSGLRGDGAGPSFSLEDEREAEVLALCLSESLFPMPEVTGEIMHQLYEIRSAYGFGALVRTRAREPWTGEIDVRFTPAAAHEFASGGYFFWNELNADLGPVRVVPLEFGRVRLSFARLFNPCLAARRYAELPGVDAAEPVFDPSDGPRIFVGMSRLYGYTYLFRDASGDCAHGCRFVEYYYFRFFDSSPVLVGRWNPAEGDPPAWWEDAVDEWVTCSCYPPPPFQPRDRRRGPREK